MTALRWGLLLATMGLGGCSGCGSEAPKAEGTTPKVVEATSAAGDRVSERSLKNSRRLLIDGGAVSRANFSERMKEEADARVAVTFTAERVFEKLEGDGISLDRKRQALAKSSQARYCMTAHAGNKIQVTVCEHEDELQAQAYVTKVEELARPERRATRRESTSLTVRRGLKGDEQDLPLVDKINASFAALK